MFATLRYGPRNSEATYVERTTKPPVQGQGHQHSACETCRAKKLRCTGQKSGCDRCLKKDIPCKYSSSTDLKKGTRRKGSQSNTTIKNGDTASSRGSATPIRPKEPEIPKNPTPAADSKVQDTVQETPPPSSPQPYQDSIDTSSGVCMSKLLLDHTDDLDDHEINFDDFLTSVNMEKGVERDDISGLATPDEPATLGCSFDMLDFPSLGSMFGHESISSPDAMILDNDDSTRTSTEYPPTPENSYISMSTPMSLETDHTRKFSYDEDLAFNLPSPSDSAIANLLVLSEDDFSTPISRAPSTASDASDGCTCMQVALSLLDHLELKGNDIFQPNAVDYVLSCQKQALGQCDKMLECKTCSARSSMLTLVVVICEKIVSSLERVASSCQEKSGNPNLAGIRSEVGGLGLWQGVSLGNYEIDSANEWWSLVSVIVFLTAKRLGCVLVRIKEAAGKFHWETHMTMLVSIDRRYHETVGVLSRICVRD